MSISETDDRVAEWNSALASGDAETINAVQRDFQDYLASVFMDGDPNYAAAGWKSNP